MLWIAHGTLRFRERESSCLVRFGHVNFLILEKKAVYIYNMHDFLFLFPFHYGVYNRYVCITILANLIARLDIKNAFCFF